MKNSMNAQKIIWGYFLPQKLFLFPEVIFRDPPNMPFKTSMRITSRGYFSETWGPPQFQEKRSRSEKAILGALGEFRGYSRSSSRNSKFHFRNTKFHSRNGIPRLEQYENHSSRSNSRSHSQNWWEPAWKIFICPCILGTFFQELGWSPRTRILIFWGYFRLARLFQKIASTDA